MPGRKVAGSQPYFPEVPGLTVARPTLEDIYLTMINAGKGVR